MSSSEGQTLSSGGDNNNSGGSDASTQGYIMRITVKPTIVQEIIIEATIAIGEMTIAEIYLMGMSAHGVVAKMKLVESWD